jgi:hypothetical protein
VSDNVEKRFKTGDDDDDDLFKVASLNRSPAKQYIPAFAIAKGSTKRDPQRCKFQFSSVPHIITLRDERARQGRNCSH